MRIFYALTDTVFQSRLFEFLIIFTFFISLLFAIFKRRFGEQRLTAALSASISLALSVGLIHWMSRHGYSITDLGPVAVIVVAAFAAAVIYSLFKTSGHGVIAILTISLLVAAVLPRTYWFFDYQTVFDLVLAGWLLILIWMLIQKSDFHRSVPTVRKRTTPEADDADEQIRQMYNDRILSKKISGQLRKLRKPSQLMGDKNAQSTDLILQLKRILPQQGYLAGRMAGLRKKAHLIQYGHIAKIKDIKKLCRQMEPLQKRKVSRQMIEYYRNQTDFDRRLERLESLVADIEKQSRQLIIRAEICVNNKAFKQYDHLIKKATKLQDNVTHIIKVMIRTEKKLSDTAHKIVREAIADNG